MQRAIGLALFYGCAEPLGSSAGGGTISDQFRRMGQKLWGVQSNARWVPLTITILLELGRTPASMARQSGDRLDQASLMRKLPSNFK